MQSGQSVSGMGQRRRGADSVASSEGYAPTATSLLLQNIGGAGQSSAIGDSEFKDTVLYMQQQQLMQQQEVVELLKRLDSRLVLEGVAGARGGGSTAGVVGGGEPGLEGTSDFVPDQELLLGTANTIKRIRTQPSNTGVVSSLHAAELNAARSRIVDLEAQVKSLQQQLASKEATIQRLCATAADNSILRFSASNNVLQYDPEAGNAARPAVGERVQTVVRGVDDGTSSVPFMLTPTRAIYEHSNAAARLDQITPSTIRSRAPSDSIPTDRRTPARQTPPPSATLSSPAEIHAALREHIHRCNMLTHR
jgi:hypothetical protein